MSTIRGLSYLITSENSDLLTPA